MLPIHTILCPLDFSEPSYKALQLAIEMASLFKIFQESSDRGP